MRPRSPATRSVISSLLLLCTLLFGGTTQAAAAEPQGHAVGAIAMTPHGRPMADAMDCPPCVACYVAPTPSQHGFGGEPGPPDEPAWPLHAADVGSPIDVLDFGGRRARLPVRIAFCRWLD